MTLIAFACHGQTAEFITDTTSYALDASELGTCTKHATINHLDAAVLTQGDGHFGTVAKINALSAAEQLTTFDEVCDTAPDWLSRIWTDLEEGYEEGYERPDSVVFLIGYSPRAEGFVAYAYASENGFEQTLCGPHTFVMPTPWATAPSQIELERFRRHESEREEIDELCDIWSSRDPLKRLTTIDEWRWLAMEVRASRALESFAHIIVAGKVIHTKLARDRVITRTIYEFNDEGDEFNQLVRNTQHPQGLAQECHCGTGKRFGDCCGNDATWCAEQAAKKATAAAV